MLEPIIMDMLEEIQENEGNLILDSVVVRKDFGLARSFQQGSDSHAVNMKVDKQDVELNNQ